MRSEVNTCRINNNKIHRKLIRMPNCIFVWYHFQAHWSPSFFFLQKKNRIQTNWKAVNARGHIFELFMRYASKKNNDFFRRCKTCSSNHLKTKKKRTNKPTKKKHTQTITFFQLNCHLFVFFSMGKKFFYTKWKVNRIFVRSWPHRARFIPVFCTKSKLETRNSMHWFNHLNH